MLDSVFAAPAYRWAEEPAPYRVLRRLWQQLGEWLEGLRIGNPLVFRILIGVLLVVSMLVLLHAVWVVLTTVRGSVATAGPVPSREPRDATVYRRMADQAAAEGRIVEALQLAFMALALTLEGQGALRYHPSMTPAECARQARLTRPDGERLGTLVRSLYAHAFGGVPCDADGYRRWRDATDPPWHATAR